MNTSKMNTRITIFSKTGGQNEDGEVVNGICKDVYSCWAEVKGNSVKEFKTSRELDSYKEVKVFIIRYHPRPPFDNSMFVDFYGQEYKINELEIDYASKETILIKAVRVS